MNGEYAKGYDSLIILNTFSIFNGVQDVKFISSVNTVDRYKTWLVMIINILYSGCTNECVGLIIGPF